MFIVKPLPTALEIEEHLTSAYGISPGRLVVVRIELFGRIGPERLREMSFEEMSHILTSEYLADQPNRGGVTGLRGGRAPVLDSEGYLTPDGFEIIHELSQHYFTDRVADA